MEKCRWLKPRLAASIEYLEWTGADHLRHAKFSGYVIDNMSTDFPETRSSVTIGALGDRARCTEAGCGNLAWLGIRYADVGGLSLLKSPKAAKSLEFWEVST